MKEAAFLNHISYPVLLQYITQKICHDLATPVGAIRLGLEHMEATDLTPLLMESIDNATTRIDVFRTLFSTSLETIDSQRVSKLLQAYMKSKNITFESSGHTTPLGARLMLGLGIVACEALPRGGRVQVDFDTLSLACEGPIVHIPYQHLDRESLLQENLHFKSGIVLYHILYLAEQEHLAIESCQEADALLLTFKSMQEIA